MRSRRCSRSLVDRRWWWRFGVQVQLKLNFAYSFFLETSVSNSRDSFKRPRGGIFGRTEKLLFSAGLHVLFVCRVYSERYAKKCALGRLDSCRYSREPIFQSSSKGSSKATSKGWSRGFKSCICYAFHLIPWRKSDRKNQPKSTPPVFMLFHMAEREGQNLSISWNFQHFKHVMLNCLSALQSRLKLSKWATFNDFKYFRHFQSFKSAPKKSAENHSPMSKFKIKGKVRSYRPHMIEHKDRGEVSPRIWADFLNFM